MGTGSFIPVTESLGPPGKVCPCSHLSDEEADVQGAQQHAHSHEASGKPGLGPNTLLGPLPFNTHTHSVNSLFLTTTDGHSLDTQHLLCARACACKDTEFLTALGQDS